MCAGVGYFANNKKAVYGKNTTSHSEIADNLKIDEDKFRKFEYWWWDKKIVDAHTDNYSQKLIKDISYAKALGLVERSVKKNFNTQAKLAKWLKGVPDEWDKLCDPKFKTLTKKVCPSLIKYQDVIAKFKKTPIEKYNPYQATKLPSLEKLRSFKKLAQVWDQVGDQVWAQVRVQVRAQVWDQVGVQVRDQVGVQVWDQVRDQVWATSYWAVKVTLGLPIKHWFFDFLKLGVMVIFVQGKAKVFGKKGCFLGEYTEEELFSKK